MPLTKDAGFDAAVLDREDLPVALIQVKAQPLGKEWTPMLRNQLETYRKHLPNADFLLAVDPACMHLYRLHGIDLDGPIVHFDTPQVLSHYEPEFGKKRIFERYVLTLVEAWLRDLAYHWKSAKPPGSDELAAVGFLAKVEGGTTQPPWM